MFEGGHDFQSAKLTESAAGLHQHAQNDTIPHVQESTLRAESFAQFVASPKHFPLALNRHIYWTFCFVVFSTLPKSHLHYFYRYITR